MERENKMEARFEKTLKREKTRRQNRKETKERDYLEEKRKAKPNE